MITPEELLIHSYKNNLGHIPSALSMLDYLNELFFNNKVRRGDHIVLGKPFGSQSYYLIWEKMGLIENIEKLSVGVKHDELNFVDFSEETMGNALGVAAGIALTTERMVWVNISDATLQMGNTLEAIQFIGQNKLKNILVTVDYNGSQVTGKTKDIIDVDPVINFFDQYNWEVNYNLKNFKIGEVPKVFIMRTVKGKGVPEIERNAEKWHYKKIENEDELKLLIDSI